MNDSEELWIGHSLLRRWSHLLWKSMLWEACRWSPYLVAFPFLVPVCGFFSLSLVKASELSSENDVSVQQWPAALWEQTAAGVSTGTHRVSPASTHPTTPSKGAEEAAGSQAGLIEFPYHCASSWRQGRSKVKPGSHFTGQMQWMAARSTKTREV